MRALYLILLAALAMTTAACDTEERKPLEPEAVAESARTDDARDVEPPMTSAPAAETHVDGEDDG